jgi:hypothetical protein
VAVVKTTLPGVDEIIAKGESKDFIFRNVPATQQCLEQVTKSLQSSYAYAGRPVRFAQGISGIGKVSFRVPFPSQNRAPVSVRSQVQLPTIASNTVADPPTISPVLRRFFQRIFPNLNVGVAQQ